MKNLIKICSSLIIVSILLSSCSQKLGIMKRHYSKGYYVESSNHNVKIQKEKTSPLIEQKVNESERSSTANLKAIPVVLKEDTSTQIATYYSNAKVPSEKISYNNVTEKKQHIKTTHNRNSGIQASKANNAVFEKQQASTNSDDDDGLSLFWILILLIVILWALGYAFLLTPFIHVLLVVALVLFILWLLHIV